MEVSMSKTRRGKYTDNRICYISKCKGDMRLYLRRKGKLPCFSYLVRGKSFSFYRGKVRKKIEICKYSYILFLVILLIYNMLIFSYRYYRVSLFLYFMLFRQIPLMMADSVLYGILHCLFLGSKNGNSKVPRSSRFWYSKKPSPSHLSNFTCWRFLEKKMNTAPPSGGSSISVLTI